MAKQNASASTIRSGGAPVSKGDAAQSGAKSKDALSKGPMGPGKEVDDVVKAGALKHMGPAMNQQQKVGRITGSHDSDDPDL